MNVVPTNRLLIVLALVLIPGALTAAAFPEWALYASAAIALCALAVSADAFASRGRVDAVVLRLPPILRLTKGKPATFQLEIDHAPSPIRELRIGLVLPTGLDADEETRAQLPADSSRSRVPWQVVPQLRGSFRLTEAVVEAASAAGLWSVRERKVVESEFRVYPNLLADKKSAAALLLSRRAGVHSFRQIGQGREFEKLREYVPGDSYNDIHWRATARHGRPVTKVFQVERTQDVYVVLDCSRLSGRSLEGEPAIEQYLSAALLLGLSVQNDGDLFGVVAFDNKVQTIVRAGTGRSHFGVCRDALFAVEAKRVSPDYRELSRVLRTRLRKRSLLMLLTDLDDTAIAQEFESSMAVVRRNHLIAANMIEPAGAVPLFSGGSVEQSGDVYDRLAGHLRWHSLEQTRRRLGAQGITLSLLNPRNPAGDLVARYRNIKGRQLL